MAKAKSTKARKSKSKRYLVIVESPAKANTIRRYLGRNFDVKASIGHVRDLPKSKLGVDVDHDFQMKFITIKGKAKIIKELKAAAKKADIVYLAPDPDREGEAIAQHIFDAIDYKGEIYRISFNEITKKAVQAAIEKPTDIAKNLVYAQQARRALDRLVGYKLSPLLWEKVRSGLSAGRVQSVAMRLILEREKEIEAFVQKEYWSIECLLAPVSPTAAGHLPKDKKGFEAKLHHIGGEKFEIDNETDAKNAVEEIKKEKLSVKSLTIKDKKRNPSPPFITSTLQSAASVRLGYSAGRTMRIAQKLYEGMDTGGAEAAGLITYMRTDSTRIADEAVAEVREYIKTEAGDNYLPDKPNQYKSKKSAQEGHEAIRPTTVLKTPESVKQYLSADEFKVYDLIWKRFVASQMKPAINTGTTLDVVAGKYLLRATGTRLKFEGFLKVYQDIKKDEENIIPPLEQGDELNLEEITPNQHFTQPPPRYSEATLIRDLEEKGIGRPSTYAAIMSTIQSRDYAESIERRLHPTELGRLITELLMEHFPTILDVQFTAQMEENLDKVEEGDKDWVTLLKEFYGPFAEALEAAHKNMKKVKAEIKTDEICDKCGADMIIKFGRFGKFMACSNYPECKNTKPVSKNGDVGSEPEKTDEKCPECGSDMVLRNGRFGKFMACSKYPECKTTKPISLGIKCPKECGGEVVSRRTKKGRTFFGCTNYPKCDFTSWQKPVNEPCPECGGKYLVYAASRNKDVIKLNCPEKECKYSKEIAKEPAETADAASTRTDTAQAESSS
ncbi:MAG: type I DNA topoisomerase [Nitrospinota bacterium]